MRSLEILQVAGWKQKLISDLILHLGEEIKKLLKSYKRRTLTSSLNTQEPKLQLPYFLF